MAKEEKKVDDDWKRRAQADKAPEPEGAGDAPQAEAPPPPRADFASLVQSLALQAFIHLGDAPDSASGKPNKNMAAARYTIDLIEVLQQKTEGNLTGHERGLLQGVLYDLRMYYVKAAEEGTS